MSDWITHIGWVYPAGRFAAGARVRLALLGAILPDLFTPLIVLTNNLHLYPGWFEAYFQPLQAPLPTACIAAGIALMTRDPRRSFFAMAVGVVIHYALDLTQIRYGGGIYLGYPLDFASPSLDLYWPESWVNMGLLAGGTIGLGWALVRPGPRIEWSGARWLPAVAVAAVGFTMPAFTIDGYHRENVNNVAFFRSPTRFEGVALSLGKVEVAAVDEQDGAFTVEIRKGSHRIRAVVPGFERWLVGEAPAGPGERISLRGSYRDGAFRASRPAWVHIRPLRTWTSLVGLVAIVFLVLPSRRQRGS